MKKSVQRSGPTPFGPDNSFSKAGLSLADGTNTFVAVAQDTLGRSDTHDSSVYLPAAVVFAYDANGNLTNDTQKTLEYDDENQLIRLTAANAWKSEFTYDGKMRRRARKEYTWSGSWILTNEVRYIYDGKLVIQERNNYNLATVGYTRGSDLSRTFGGAGGIGGLLARSDHLSLVTSHAYYYADGNGNITTLIDTNQNVVARYAYEPFGRVFSMSGPLADANLYRFSSKEVHLPSGLVYYLYRYYDPNLQRWPNRDPLGDRGFIAVARLGQREPHIAERGPDGPNLYNYVRNTPINLVDVTGLTGWGFHDPFGKPLPMPPIPEGLSECLTRIKDEVWNQFGWDEQGNPRAGHRPGDNNFHYGHCVAHCRIQRECPGGRLGSWAGGIAKEVWDEIRQWFGSGGGWEGGDLDANREGRKRGRQCPEKSCEEACKGTEG